MEQENEEANDVTIGEEFLFGLSLKSIEGVVDERDDSISASLPVNPCNKNDITATAEWVKGLCRYEHDFGTPTTDEDFDKLFVWAKTQGASIEGISCQTDSHGGRGIFATRDLVQGEIIAVLPRPLRWGQSHACKTMPLLPTSTPDLTALTLLVIYMCQEDHIFSKCLPHGIHSNALLFSEEETEFWNEVDHTYSEAIRRNQSLAEGCQGYIRHMLMQEESSCPSNFSSTFKWAVAMVKSRSHAFGSSSGYWITPILDLLNHSPHPNATFSVGNEGQLLLQVSTSVPRGTEIMMDYQVENDATLLASYGFSLVHTTGVPTL